MTRFSQEQAFLNYRMAIVQGMADSPYKRALIEAIKAGGSRWAACSQAA